MRLPCSGSPRCSTGTVLTPVRAKVVWYLNRVLYHVDLDYKAQLAPGFKLVHGLGVVVGAGVVSDGPLTVYQGVTIGGSHGCSRKDGRGGVFWRNPTSAVR